GPYLHQPHYFLPPPTFAIIKMISATNPTTRKMPHTMPALKIPSTTEQLPREKARKQAREEIHLILILSILHPNRIPLFISLIFASNGRNFPAFMWNGFYNVLDFLHPFTISPPKYLSRAFIVSPAAKPEIRKQIFVSTVVQLFRHLAASLSQVRYSMVPQEDPWLPKSPRG